MRVRRQIDHSRGLVRITVEFPFGMRPDRAADLAWAAVDAEMTKVQERAAAPAAEGVVQS